MESLRTHLSTLTDEVLRQKALALGLTPPEETSRVVLIEMIIAVQHPEETASGFADLKGGEGSGFINQKDGGGEGSGFINPKDGGGEGSGFVNQRGGDEGSGFINPKDGGGEGSGFVDQRGGGGDSGFLDQRKDTASSPSEILPLPTGDVLGGKAGGGKSNRHQLGPGDVLDLNGTSYTITQILSQSSGEAVIYMVLPPGGEKECVLKLYFEQKDPSREPNAEALARIREIRDPDILELLDFGTGPNKVQHKGKAYCFELSAFARGGNLLDVPDLKAKYTVDFITQHVVPEIFQGLQILHQQRIYHGDIKPHNIFYLDEARTDLVIGDYGSAKTFEMGGEENLTAFSTVIGTNYYLAPEQAKGIMSEKNDYYAFGVVLLHLLYPAQYGREDDLRKVDFEKYRRFTTRQYSGKPVVDFDPAYGRLNDLIAGLTLVDHTRRWGEREVQRWLNNERNPINYSGLDIKPIKTGYSDIYSAEDLIDFIERYPQQWYGSLIGDRHGFDALMDWYLSLTDLNRKRAFEEMILHYKGEGAEYVREAILRYIDPARPVQVGKSAFQFYETPDLRGEIRRFWAQLDLVWRQDGIDLKVFRYALFVFEFALQQAAQSGDADTQTLVEKVLGSTAQILRTDYDASFAGQKARIFQAVTLNRKEDTRQRARLLQLFHLFQPERGIRDLAGTAYSDLERIGGLFAQQPDLYEHPLMRMELHLYLQKSKRKELLNLSYGEFLLRVFAREARTEVEVTKVKVDSQRHYRVSYTCWRSLDEALQQRGITAPAALSQAQQETYEFAYPKPFTQSPGGVYTAFMAHLSTQHHLPAEALSPSNQQRLRRKLWINGLGQGLGRGLLEWVAAVPLVLPLLVGAALLGLSDRTGSSLLAQYAQNTGLMDYFADAERYGTQTSGLYLWALLCVSMYILALIPRIWTGPRLQLIGKTAARTSLMLSIRGGTGFLFALWLLLMPAIFSLSNWLWEGLAFIGFIVMASLMQQMEKRDEDGSRRRGKWRIVALLLIGGAIARLALELLDNGGNLGGDSAAYGRGGIDIAFYVLAGFFFYFPPVYVQLFRAHNALRYGLKVGLLAVLGLVFLFGLPGSPGKGHIDLQNLALAWPSGPAPAPDPILPDVYLARISDGYSGINLRSGRGTKSEVIRVVQAGEYFLVQTDPRTGWWWVTTGTGDHGFMHSSKIKREREARESDEARFPAFRREGPATDPGEPEPVEADAPQAVLPEPAPAPQPEAPVRPTQTSGDRILPDPRTSRLSERELGRFLQGELSRLADPSVAPSERRALEGDLLDYFQDEAVPVTQVLSTGRPIGSPSRARAYLMRLRMTGNHRVVIKGLETQAGKVTALTVHEQAR